VRLALVVLVCACRAPLTELDGAFYNWDGRTVHCAVEVDDRAGFEWQDIADGLDRARANGEVLELLVHRPGDSMAWDRFEQLLAGVRERELAFVTATDLVRGTPTAGVALMYDDWWLDTWLASLDLLTKYQARVTLHIAHFDGFDDNLRAQVRQLADAGNDIQAHGVLHIRGPNYVESHGVSSYVADEVAPSIDGLRDAGYDVVTFAYPFGMHTDEIDRAILDTHKVATVRTLTKPQQLRENPCPY
jgi:hypothetical protein